MIVFSVLCGCCPQLGGTAPGYKYSTVTRRVVAIDHVFVSQLSVPGTSYHLALRIEEVQRSIEGGCEVVDEVMTVEAGERDSDTIFDLSTRGSTKLMAVHLHKWLHLVSCPGRT